MDRTEEAHSLVDLFRQYEESDRRALLAEMVEIAVARLTDAAGAAVQLESPGEAGYSFEIRERLLSITRTVRSSPRASRAARAAATVVDLGAWNLGGGEIDPLRFASVAIAWSGMDTKGGRQVSAARRQFEELVLMHPEVPAKVLLNRPEAAGLELSSKRAQNLRSALLSRQPKPGNL